MQHVRGRNGLGWIGWRVLAISWSFGCGPPPPSAQDTLPRLRQALSEPVTSKEQNQQNSQLTSEVSKHRLLHGLTRSDVERELGKGAPCSEHPLCHERGFFPDDWYYEVGDAGASYIRHRPALVVGFNRFGKVERTFVLEVR